MSFFWEQLLRLQFAVTLLCVSVDALATFVNPPGPDGALTLTIGDQFLIAWQNAGTDYSELSLGVLAQANDNIFWLISNDLAYTSTNYLYTVALGNGITLQQGNIFSFILVNGTNFGEQVVSPLFTIQAKSSSTTTSSSASTTATSSSTSTNASATTIPSTYSSTSPTSSPTSAASSGLSTGTKVGVGVGVPIAALAVIGVAFMFFSRRRRNRTGENHYVMSPGSDQDKKYVFTGLAEAPASSPSYRRQQIYEAPPGRNEGVFEVAG